MTKRLSLWLSEDEQKEIQKYRKKALEEKRSLGNYCKKILFGKEVKKWTSQKKELSMLFLGKSKKPKRI